tara:strand:+ start:499 stop:681 length:183 start_codon:yes stop_codon:yes gene_type:complete
LKNKPIRKEAKIIFKILIVNVLLNINNFSFFKKINKIIELNQDDIDVAIGIIINPISSKK